MEAMTLATSIAVMNEGKIEQIDKPMEIYNNPKSLFVAKFVGSPQMNIVNSKKDEKLATCLSKKINIEKEKVNAEKLQNLENINIPAKFDYNKLKSLSSEAKSKLEDIRPKTLSQASRISGVSPADISAMLVFMGR